jgi:hypothetical protein
MRDDPGARQCLFKKGVRYPEQVKDHSKTAFSTMFCACGDGNLTPTMTVFKGPSGNFYETWATGAPPGSVFTANKSGSFNMREFETFFEKVFLKYIDGRIPKEDVKILIGDNLGAHISPIVMEKCKEHNIRSVWWGNIWYIWCPLYAIVYEHHPVSTGTVPTGTPRISTSNSLNKKPFLLYLKEKNTVPNFDIRYVPEYLVF